MPTLEKTRKIRVIDFDGMGGSEYEYYCSACRKKVKTEYGFCPHCGADIKEVELKDTWGLR